MSHYIKFQRSRQMRPLHAVLLLEGSEGLVDLDKYSLGQVDVLRGRLKAHIKIKLKFHETETLNDILFVIQEKYG
jgi:hypothetical protein